MRWQKQHTIVTATIITQMERNRAHTLKIKPMKKILLTIMTVSILALAPVASVQAQVTPTAEQQINELRAQLIELYMVLIAQLQAQIDEINARQTVVEEKQEKAEKTYAKKTSSPKPSSDETVDPGTPASKVLNLEVTKRKEFERDGVFTAEILVKADDAEAYIHSIEGEYDTLTTETPKQGDLYKLGEDDDGTFILTSTKAIIVTGVRYSTTASGDVQTKGI